MRTITEIIADIRNTSPIENLEFLLGENLASKFQELMEAADKTEYDLKCYRGDFLNENQIAVARHLNEWADFIKDQHKDLTESEEKALQQTMGRCKKEPTKPNRK